MLRFVALSTVLIALTHLLQACSKPGQDLDVTPGTVELRPATTNLPSRRWVGEDFFAMPLHDWSAEGDSFIAEPANYGGHWRQHQARLYVATAEIGTAGSFALSFRVQNETIEALRSKKGRAGVWLGLQSATPSPQNVWIHPPPRRIFVGIDGTGRLRVNGSAVSRSPGADDAITIEIKGLLGASEDRLQVTAHYDSGKTVQHLESLPGQSLSGTLSLLAKGEGTRWRFTNLHLFGDALVDFPARRMGAILWSQYTLQDSGELKLLAQMVPLEKTDPQTASLQFRTAEGWREVATAELDWLSSTFLFRVPGVTAARQVPYRVVYHGAGDSFTWEGEIRANPGAQGKFTLGVFNCNHGELFANTTLVRNVALQDPDMVFFAGDQIYEGMDKVAVVREPLAGSRLSYLSKYYQFGLSWREILKDRPSVIIPDDHDVFMPNIWGDNGRGYIMEADWVNMVQRTQTGSLPDPVDPTPVERGIGVYFTALDYAGMSFAIIEDRKFKSSPRMVRHIRSQGPAALTDLDTPEGVLLGKRQLAFLQDWAARTETLPVRWVFSQSMFAKANTHIGKTLRRFYRDMDTNGWPQSARNRALQTIPRDTIMVHGDQHLGMLARMGTSDWEDGPLAFMVTGSAVGFPRAWWPDVPPANGLINGPHTGRHEDDMGNKITVFGVTNPAPLPPGGGDAVKRPDLSDLGEFAIQDAKGAGHGLVTVDKARQEARFEAYRLDFDASAPQPTDQFPGFPITLPLRPGEPQNARP